MVRSRRNNLRVAALVSQPLHGLTFALLHLACMRIMEALIAARVAATAQALYAFGSGSLTAALTLLSGTLYASHGGEPFFSMAALCVIALPFAWFGIGVERGRSAQELSGFSAQDRR